MKKLLLITLLSLITLSLTTTPNLKDTTTDFYSNIIEGMIEGLSKENSQKCLSDYKTSKDSLIVIGQDFMNEILSGVDFSTAIFNAANKILMEHSNMIGDCNILMLAGVLNEFLSEDSRRILIEKVANNREDLYKVVPSVISNLKKGDFKNSAFYFGKAIQIVFDYYVN
jgi:hypothetical protein